MSDIYDKLHTIPKAATLIGVKPHSLRRAVDLGLVPHYRCFNSRKLVKPTVSGARTSPSRL